MELKNCLNENKKIPADLKIKLAVYVVNCLFLALVNYVTSPHYWWVYWAVLGWGLNVALSWIIWYFKKNEEGKI